VACALLATALIATVTTGCGSSADAARPAHETDQAARGRYLHGTYDAARGVYTYALYVPTTYRTRRRVALVVVVHGCGTTANEQAQASNYDPLAEQNDFIVLYPDNGRIDTNPARCWRALTAPQLEGRGRGDAAAIAGMTRAIMRAWSIDSSRVYVIGMSSGAFEVPILGAAYPDLYAAIGIHSGAAFMRGEAPGCVNGLPATPSTAAGYQPSPSTTVLARAAYAAEGRRARIVPVIVFHGDNDPTIPYSCGRQALAQWLQTDDDVLAAAKLPPIGARPTSNANGQVPGGLRYTVQDYRPPGGCLVAQFWTIHGMGHDWSGGSRDPSVAAFTNPNGPSAAAASWAFFSGHRLTPAGAVSPCIDS
jgi:poly(hydroxyalkanoate) depolymerase family esterase